MGMKIKDYKANGNIKLSRKKIRKFLLEILNEDKPFLDDFNLETQNRSYKKEEKFIGKAPLIFDGNYNVYITPGYDKVIEKNTMNEKLVA